MKCCQNHNKAIDCATRYCCDACPLKRARELDWAIDAMLTAADARGLRGTWQVTDCLLHYVRDRLERADDPRPLSRMERRYCRKIKQDLWMDLARSDLPKAADLDLVLDEHGLAPAAGVEVLDEGLQVLGAA